MGRRRIAGRRIRELIAPLGYAGGKAIVDDYVREDPAAVRPAAEFSAQPIRPAEICQFDLWEPRADISVGHGRTRQGWIVVACLGWSRARGRRVGPHQADAGSVGRDPALLVVPGHAAAMLVLGP